jgi:hypothetical protein
MEALNCCASEFVSFDFLAIILCGGQIPSPEAAIASRNLLFHISKLWLLLGKQEQRQTGRAQIAGIDLSGEHSGRDRMTLKKSSMMAQTPFTAR